MEIKPMSLLILEDDADECKNLSDCIKLRDDFKLVHLTDSDVEALKFVKLKKPEGIILDIELNNSSSGNINSLEFLKTLRQLNLSYRPVVVVTTHVKSKITYDIFHRNGADIILYKYHPSYSPDMVLNTLLAYRKEPNNNNVKNLKISAEDYEARVREYISNELELIGIAPNLKGRKYIYDSILYIFNNMNNPEPPNVFKYIEKTYGRSTKTIANSIQIAIRHAWRVSSIEDLTRLYTVRINPETGVPTPTEFIHYYADKTKRNV